MSRYRIKKEVYHKEIIYWVQMRGWIFWHNVVGSRYEEVARFLIKDIRGLPKVIYEE